jgi:hypothetical protein
MATHHNHLNSDPKRCLKARCDLMERLINLDLCPADKECHPTSSIKVYLTI